MKISIVASSIFPGNSLGIEYFTYGLINALALEYPKHYFDILVPVNSVKAWQSRIATGKNIKFHEVLLSPGFFSESKSISKGKILSLRTAIKRNRFAKKMYSRLQAIEETNLLRRLSPNIVYYPFHRHPVRNVKLPIVVTVHDLRSFTPEFFDEQDIKIITKNVDTAHALICSWKHPYTHVSQLFPQYVQKLNLIPFPPPILSSLQRVSSVVALDEILLLYPSWVTPHKNHIKLLEAMPDVIMNERMLRKRNVKLVCVGSFEKDTLDMLNQTIRDLSLQENVEFTGFVNDDVLRDYYYRANMIVCPTLWEAAAGTIFEAFTFEKPIACSRIAPIVSQVEHSNARVSFFDPLNPADISRAILDVLSNPLPFVRGSRRGSEFVRSLNWHTTCVAYMNIFKEVTN